MENKFNYYLDAFRKELPIKESFDMSERFFYIGNRKAYLYFVNGLVAGEDVQRLMGQFMRPIEFENGSFATSEEFIARSIPYLDTALEEDPLNAAKELLSGRVPIIADGLDRIIILDAKEYPQRSIEEPDKEKTLRGAKDGFSEIMMTNIGLIRRRIRDSRLIFSKFCLGEESKSDVALCYMKGIADQSLVDKISRSMKKIKVTSMTVCEQTLVEQLINEKYNLPFLHKLNPFPKVRYTQRPDVIAAHLTEGKIAIIVDNSPTVILFPVGLLDFYQDMDDYYFPILTGNYLKFIRMINGIAIIIIPPLYLSFLSGDVGMPPELKFFVPQDGFAIPLFWQFILLEIAITGLKLASLNTPQSLGMSLSVIGALIIGDMAIDCGWFVPHTIFTMAVVALASFTQPSIELSYAMKFIRLAMLIGVQLLGLWGGIGALAAGMLLIAMTRNLAGRSYLYPIIPFKGKALKRQLFRTQGHRN